MRPRSPERRKREEIFASRMGPAIRARRTELGMTAVTLARRAKLDPSFLSKIESGDCLATASTYHDIEVALGWGPGQLAFVAHDSQSEGGK